MKLDKSISIARESKLECVGEAILNIYIHAEDLFDAGNMFYELVELDDDFEHSNLAYSDLI